jgi:hypothetical protein
MRRAVVEARRCAVSVILFCVATGPTTARQFQALDVFAQAAEPVRLASDDERQAWASAEPDAQDLCERAKASQNPQANGAVIGMLTPHSSEAWS